ncbi:MAG: class I SAM-dependent methyltransferase [Muribaculaceae bacterium]|nr:class I SAM-dependent methyltransferase [Muribaculaceae bacterium]
MEIKSLPPKVRLILTLCGVEPGMRVLDLGTGTGVLLPYLSEMVGPDGHVTGVDISRGMLAECERKNSHLGNVSLECKDFETEPIDGKFDLVLLYCVYPHLHYPIATLRRLFDESLAPEGRIIIAFPNDEVFVNNIHADKHAPHEPLPSATSLAARLAAAGFPTRVVAESEELYIVEIEK